jgi:hypothetical protein
MLWLSRLWGNYQQPGLLAVGTYIRTSTRLGHTARLVSYQRPLDYLVNSVVILFLVWAVLDTIFGSWLKWLISAFILWMWLASIQHGGIIAKIIWSLILLFDVQQMWVATGCLGNANYCVQIEADRIAGERAAAVQRVDERKEECSRHEDWRTDPDCMIYTEQEIYQARTKADAELSEQRKNVERERQEDDRNRQDQLERRQQYIRDRDEARRANSYH